MLFHVILSSHTLHHFLSSSTPPLSLLSYPFTSPSYFVIFTYFLTLSAFSFFFFSHIFIFSPSSFPRILLSFPRLYLYFLAFLLSFFLLSSYLRSFPRHTIPSLYPHYTYFPPSLFISCCNYSPPSSSPTVSGVRPVPFNYDLITLLMPMPLNYDYAHYYDLKILIIFFPSIPGSSYTTKFSCLGCVPACINSSFSIPIFVHIFYMSQTRLQLSITTCTCIVYVFIDPSILETWQQQMHSFWPFTRMPGKVGEGLRVEAYMMMFPLNWVRNKIE